MVRNYVKKIKSNLDFLSFPLLAALARKPLTTREISRLLHLSSTATKARLASLHKRGLITKGSDRKWVPIVGLRLEKAPEMPTYPTAHVPFGEPTGDRLEDLHKNAPEAPQEAAGEVEAASVSTYVPPPAPTVYKPKAPPAGTSEQAIKVSKHFRVPAYLGRVGEVSVGKLGQCECGTVTPLKYGGKPLCPLCSRGGR